MDFNDLVGFLMLLPILIALLNSFKTDGEIFRNIIAFPEVWSFDNYTSALREPIT
jgi:raffinose/stachyose/melibiose transport system permease protein